MFIKRLSDYIVLFLADYGIISYGVMLLFFIGVEFDAFRTQAGSNAFTMSPSKWIDATNAIGIVSKSVRYGGTFAHFDTA